MYYLAYGSNLHPLRLKERVSSAMLLTTVALRGYQLMFHKRGADESAKCNLLYRGESTQSVHAAVYELAEYDKAILDRYEGVGQGYRVEQLTVPVVNEQLNCFIYVAEDSHIDDTLLPHHWYKRLVLMGAQYHGLPEAYIESIRSVESIDDPDETRNRLHQQLITKIQAV